MYKMSTLYYAHRLSGQFYRVVLSDTALISAPFRTNAILNLY